MAAKLAALVGKVREVMRLWRLIFIWMLLAFSLLPCSLFALTTAIVNSCPPDTSQMAEPSLTKDAIANALGWTPVPGLNRCNGYYLEAPFNYPQSFLPNDQIQITSNQGLVFAQHGTSISQGAISIVRAGQQITAKKGYLYRDPKTGKLSAIDLYGDVHLREPNVLVIGTQGHFNIITRAKSLLHAIYRQAIYSDASTGHADPNYQQQQSERKITQLSAWGQAKSFTQDQPMIYNFDDASYSTCPPTTSTWNVRASHINLNKNTGRGTATNARLYVQGIPVFYTPYMNFPIDARRQTGFLSPRFGTSNQLGHFLMTPFYWNLAPNYDTTITPAYLSKRGMQFSDRFRYLTETTNGIVNVSILPNDRGFNNFQDASQNTYQNSASTFTQANLRRLENDSTTRKALSWQNNAIYNDNWTSNIDFNYVSDDYYLRNLGGNLDTVSDNQLLQQGEIDYASEHWNFTTRYQGYQTLNQVDSPSVNLASYSRAPQFILGGHDSNDTLGIQYFINNDVTRFYLNNTPGDPLKYPMGTRANVQPGFNRPFNLPYFYLTPEVQFALTKYEISDVGNNISNSPSRELPIFDINSGLYFDRQTGFLGTPFKQTLEPEVLYTYIPFKNQSQLPNFDTNVNQLTYDQLFNYNRFSGLDRIGDADQIAAGVTTRFIDENTGTEKIRAGIGQIYYFKKRLVTLCTDSTTGCTDLPSNPNNTSPHSPIDGMVTYTVNPDWSVTGNAIYNVKTTRMDNDSITLTYKPTEDPRKIFNLTYNFYRVVDVVVPGTYNPNLSQTDFSFTWPLTRDWSAVGRWTENWNQLHFQNLLGGLQYDSCCYAVRVVGGRSFVSMNPNYTYQYNPQIFLEFALKGLGTWGPEGDSSTLLANSIPGYQSNFGRDF